MRDHVKSDTGPVTDSIKPRNSTSNEVRQSPRRKGGTVRKRWTTLQKDPQNRRSKDWVCRGRDAIEAQRDRHLNNR